MAAGMVAFLVLFSFGDGGVSEETTLIVGAIGASAAFVVVFWFTWLDWRSRQLLAWRRQSNRRRWPFVLADLVTAATIMFLLGVVLASFSDSGEDAVGAVGGSLILASAELFCGGIVAHGKRRLFGRGQSRS